MDRPVCLGRSNFARKLDYMICLFICYKFHLGCECIEILN